MANSIKYYTVEELDTLIEPLKTELKLNEGELSVRLGYNEGYISQVKSRKQIPAKLINNIRRELLILRKATPGNRVEADEYLEKNIWCLIEDRARALAVIEKLTAILQEREKRIKDEIVVGDTGDGGTRKYKKKSA